MIISASRRTDIPAFYSDWFMNRIKAGFVMTRNPFNSKQIRQISLLPADVDVIVFWTRNAFPMLKHLNLLDEMGYRYYFQYTITGYPRPLETATLHPLKAIDNFIKLSQQIGKEKVIWRYDPILLCNLLPAEEHIRLFSRIAGLLQGYTTRVVVSFADFYKKTERNLRGVGDLTVSDITQNREQYSELSKALSQIAAAHEMEIFSCSEKVIDPEHDIPHGACIDAALIEKLFHLHLSVKKDKNQRTECLCVQSVDIGAYNTCVHGCQYCYATYHHQQAVRNYKQHDPDSPFLLNPAELIPVR